MTQKKKPYNRNYNNSTAADILNREKKCRALPIYLLSAFINIKQIAQRWGKNEVNHLSEH